MAGVGGLVMVMGVWAAARTLVGLGPAMPSRRRVMTTDRGGCDTLARGAAGLGLAARMQRVEGLATRLT